MTVRPTMPSLDHQWTEDDWNQLSVFHAWKAAAASKHVPLAAVFSALKCGDAVRERITRLQPRGPKEGDLLRGRHPHHSFAQAVALDVLPVAKFIRKYGRSAYRSLPRSAFIRRGHRKAVTREYVEDHF